MIRNRIYGRVRVVPGPLALLIVASSVAGCAASEDSSAEPATRESAASATDESATPGSGELPAPADRRGGPLPAWAGPILDLPPVEPRDPAAAETERDWEIARGVVEWALEQELAPLGVGEVAAIVGSTFVGAPYEPGTLEPPGPERLVVNLSTFDCVTFVEHALVLARLVTGDGAELLDDARAFREAYTRELASLRYREGRPDGYESRLHYFTEWLDHAAARGVVEDVTASLGGVPDPRPIHFMTSNQGAYRQIAEDPSLVPVFREMEERLSAGVRLFVPQDRIAEIEAGIRNGDVIAAVSTLDGLDIAHTGLAIRREGRVHLLHAPLVGDSVEVSAVPLADRIQGIRGQQGIRVARPR